MKTEIRKIKDVLQSVSSKLVKTVKEEGRAPERIGDFKIEDACRKVMGKISNINEATWIEYIVIASKNKGEVLHKKMQKTSGIDIIKYPSWDKDLIYIKSVMSKDEIKDEFSEVKDVLLESMTLKEKCKKMLDSDEMKEAKDFLTKVIEMDNIDNETATKIEKLYELCKNNRMKLD